MTDGIGDLVMSIKATNKYYNNVNVEEICFVTMEWCCSGICTSTKKQAFTSIFCVAVIF